MIITLIRAEVYSEGFFIRRCRLKAAVSASNATPFGATAPDQPETAALSFYETRN